MRHVIISIIIGLFVLLEAPLSLAVTPAQNQPTTIKKMLTEDYTAKSRKAQVVKKKQVLKNKSVSAYQTKAHQKNKNATQAHKRVKTKTAHVKEKKNLKKNPIASGKNSKKKINTAVARKMAPNKGYVQKQYWSVQCYNGFIKNSYVYCARINKNKGIAKSNKSTNHKMMRKTARAVNKENIKK